LKKLQFKTTKHKTMAATASEKEPLVQPEANDKGAGVVDMGDVDDTTKVEEDFGTTAAGWTVGGAWEAFVGSNSCPDPLKVFWKENGQKVTPHLGKAQQMLKDNNKVVAMTHGLLCVFYGGCFHTISLILAFISVYDVSSWWKDVKSLTGNSAPAKSPSKVGGGNTAEPVTPAKAMAVMASTCKFFTVCYAVWFSPFLAAVCVAIAIEPYVTASLESTPKNFAELQRLNSQTMDKIGMGAVNVNWFKFELVMVLRVALSLVSYLLMPGFFSAIFMGLYGMTVACSTAGQRVDSALNNGKTFGEVSFKTIILWAVVLIGTFWQSYCGYEASLIQIAVPIGFLVCYSGNISPTYWRRAFFKKKPLKDVEDPHFDSITSNTSTRLPSQSPLKVQNSAKDQ